MWKPVRRWLRAILLERESAARTQAEERLAQSEARLRALIEHATEAIWSVDRDYVLLTFNEVFRTQFVDIFGRAPGIGEVVPTDMLWTDLYKRALAGERFTVEHEYKAQGKTQHQVISLNPIYSDASVAGVAIFSRDITERKRLEAQLLQSQKMEGIGRLAGGVALDFNNLLTAIIGNAELALDRFPADHAARAEIAEIARVTDRAVGPTRQLLPFARRQIIEPHVIDLNQLILGMDALLRRLIGEDIELETSPAHGLWSVKVDPGQIEQVIVNLAVNARDAMPDGGKLTIATGNVTWIRSIPANMSTSSPAAMSCWRSAIPASAWTSKCASGSLSRFLPRRSKGAEAFARHQDAVHLGLYQQCDRASWPARSRCRLSAEAVLACYPRA